MKITILEALKGENRMKVYISGDTGAEDYVECFMEAEETLTRKGDTVLNRAAKELL